MKSDAIWLSRRAALVRAATLFGGALTATQLGLVGRSLAAAPGFLNAPQLSTVSTIADLIIPETDTPGALAAGVPQFIDTMLAQWASPQRQGRYFRGLEAIDARALQADGKRFAASSKRQQLKLVAALDAEAFAPDADDSFFKELKKMVLFAYYSSQPGATEELQYQALPVDYRACVSMDEIGRAWFWNGYAYGL